MELRLSIVVALKDGADNLPELLEALAEGGGDTEIIISSAGPAPPTQPGTTVTTVSLPVNTLVPCLWSEGIARSRGPAVALTTAEFVPSRDWLARIHAADLQNWVGVGGAIDNDPNASARNWAIFFLRYSGFAPPLSAGETNEIAADNAVYDRAAILEHRDLLREGFWEPSFHRRFRAAGRKLMLDPELVIVHHGTVSASSFTHQRYLHGRAYGIERAERGGLARNLFLLVLSPLVAPLLLARVISRMVRRPAYRSKILPAFPWLIRFILAWAMGEAAGYLATLGTTTRGGAAIPSKGHT